MINFFKENKSNLFLFCIICGGAALRLYNLGKFDFWYDEVLSIIMSKKIPILLAEYPMFNATPPFFNILLKAWLYLGEGEFILRLLPFIFGVLSIFVIYKLGDLLFSKKVGLISAFMLSISPFHVCYAQELRAYSLMVFLSTMSIYFLIMALRKNKLNLWIAYIIFNSLALYSHNYVLLLVIVHNIFFLIFYKKYKQLLKKWVSVQFIILFLYLPWLIISYAQIHCIFDRWYYSWMASGNLRDLVNTFSILLGGYTSILIRSLLLLITVPLFIRGLKVFNNKKEEIVLLILWLAIPILIVLFISKVFHPIYLYRAFICISPAFYIISSLGIANVNKKIQLYFFIFFIGLSILALKGHYRNVLSANIFDRIGITPRKEHKLTANYIQSNFREFDVVGHVNYCTIPSFWFYSGQKEIGRTLGGIIESGIIKNTLGIRNFIKGYERIWLIYSDWNPETLSKYPDRKENRIKQWLDVNCVLLEDREFKGITVYLYGINNNL